MSVEQTNVKREGYFDSEPLAEAIADRAGTYDAALSVFKAAVGMLKDKQAECERLRKALRDIENVECGIDRAREIAADALVGGQS